VLCLIADPERTPLDGATVAAMQRALGGTAPWLADDEPCQLPVEGGDGRGIRARAEAVLGNPPYDVGVVPAAGRRKRLLVSDMDSTMINVECIDELADYLGVKAQVSAITRRAINGELQPAGTLAVGDGANDLPMLRDAGLGVTFRPSSAVAAVVPVVIRRGDLTGLLYLQGVAKSAFVSS
jgi:hypothetical protein